MLQPAVNHYFAPVTFFFVYIGTTVYLSSLLLLCRENPYSFFEVGGIPLLLALIRESDPSYSSGESSIVHSQKFRSQHNNIFSTLLAFKYDTSALAELVKGGAVDILTSRVIKYYLQYIYLNYTKINFSYLNLGILICSVRDKLNIPLCKVVRNQEKPI